jgi:DNA polymerase-3 subunit alpha
MGASSSDSKFNDYINEMKHRGISLYLPSINESTNEFEIKDNGLILPLNIIKGVPSQVMFNIVKERKENGQYKDFLDFVSRNKRYGITALQLTKIINSGAFDCFSTSRSTLLSYVPSALQYADIITDKVGQLTLGFEAMEKPIMKEEMDDPLEKLALEYETIGIMLSNNPLSYKKDLIKSVNAINLSLAKETNRCLTVGLIRSVKTIMNKKGQEMAFVKLFDETDEMEITIFQDTYKECFDLLKKNNIVLASIRENIHQDNKTYIAEKITLLEE